MSGLVSVLNAIHSPACAFGKNARLVAVAIAWHMGAKSEAWPTLVALVAETSLGRTAVMEAISEVCGHQGLFVRKKRGPGKCNLYALRKTAGFPEVMNGGRSAQTAGKPDVKTAGFPDAGAEVKTAGFPYTEQISTFPRQTATIRRRQNIQERMKRLG